MSCFKDLIKSRFLADALKELQEAHQSIQQQAPSTGMYSYSFDKKAREAAYKFYMQVYGLKDELYRSALTDSKHIINYIQVDHISFSYSRSKKLIKEMIDYSFNLYGTLPYIRKKHVVAGVTVYTLLSDLRFSVPPAAVN